MLIPSLALITILFLLLVWATIRERVMAKEIKLAKQFYAAIWNNAHYILDRQDFACHQDQLLHSLQDASPGRPEMFRGDIAVSLCA